MEEVIRFDKSFQQRYSEYCDIFADYEILPASKLKNHWSFFIELTIDKIGWQAIWKIPRLTCKSLNIPFPSFALVIVVTINTKELKALIRILSMQNDVTISEKHWVPITQLWPTKEQDSSIYLALIETANSIDVMRFFYLYLYMPWDRDEDDTIDWKEKHLQSRLKFYFDLKNGNIPRAVAEHTHNLLTEAKRLENKRDFLEEELNQEEQQGDQSEISEDDRVKSLMEIHVRLLEIKAEIEIIENPLLRDIIIERYSKVNKIPITSDPQIYLIYTGGTAEQHIQFLTQVKSIYPQDNLQFCTNFAAKLETANRNDTYLLNESTHKIFTIGALEEGGIVRGIGEKSNILLMSEVENIMLDIIGESVVLENLTIDANVAQLALLVRKGKCILKKCKIVGKGTSPIYQGIMVLKEAYLELQDCEITGFSTAITGNSGSRIVLKNCDIHHVDTGIKFYDDSNFVLENVVIRECTEFGILLKTETKNMNVGDVERLKLIPEVTYSNITCTNNRRGDVAIIQETELKPIDDLFSDPNNDPTVIGSDDEVFG